jgi:hypothetical protein
MLVILQRALYGRKQSSRSWYARLSDMLLQLSFIAIKADTMHQGITIHMLVLCW